MDFFTTRFANMRWSILTPYRAAHWDGANLTMAETPDKTDFPKEDELEPYWLKYYASTFNPARPKKSAMLNQMPMKYWKNMPETRLIPELLQNAESRAKKMIEQSQQNTSAADENNQLPMKKRKSNVIT
jgi:DNA polymerase